MLHQSIRDIICDAKQPLNILYESIESVVRISGIVSYMLIRCPILGACALTIIPAVAVVNKAYSRFLSKNAAEVQEALACANQGEEDCCDLHSVRGSCETNLSNPQWRKKLSPASGQLSPLHLNKDST